MQGSREPRNCQIITCPGYSCTVDILSGIKDAITPGHEKDDDTVEQTLANDCLAELCQFGAFGIVTRFLQEFPDIQLRIKPLNNFYSSVPVYMAAMNHANAESQDAAGVVLALLRHAPKAKYDSWVLNICASKDDPGYSFKPKLRKLVLADPDLMFEVLAKKIPFLYDVMAKPTPRHQLWGDPPKIAKTIATIQAALAKAIGAEVEDMTHDMLQPFENLQSFCNELGCKHPSEKSGAPVMGL